MIIVLFWIHYSVFSPKCMIDRVSFEYLKTSPRTSIPDTRLYANKVWKELANLLRTRCSKWKYYISWSFAFCYFFNRILTKDTVTFVVYIVSKNVCMMVKFSICFVKNFFANNNNIFGAYWIRPFYSIMNDMMSSFCHHLTKFKRLLGIGASNIL